MSHSLQCTVLFSPLNCLFSANFLFTISAFVSFFSASLILILTQFVCFHCPQLLHFTCPDFVFVPHMLHTSFLVVLFLGFCGSHLPLRQFVLHCNSKYKIVTGLHDSRCMQMCTLIFAFRSCYCLGSFILQDLFQVSKYFSVEGQNTKLSVNVFLTCIIFFDAGPSSD